MEIIPLNSEDILYLFYIIFYRDVVEIFLLISDNIL